MSSSDDNYASHRRRNPRRTCRPIVEEPDKSHTPASGDKVSVLHRNNSKMTEDLHPARSRGLRKTRNDKQKPQAVSLSACPKSLPKCTRQGRCLNGHVSANSHKPEPIKRPKLKYPAKTTKRSRKGRTKSDVEPCEKADVPASNDGDCFKRLEDSEPAASAGSQNAAKSYRTCLRPSNKNLDLVSPGLFTRTALMPQKQKISRHTKNGGSSSPHTPKRINVRPGPLLSSTPNSNLESLNRADSSCSPCHRDVTQSSPLSSPDVKPLRKCKTQRLLAAERPAGRKKRIVHERPGSSRPPKRSRKSESFLKESPQKEPSVETPPTSRTEEQDPSLSSDLSIELSLQEELQPFYHSLSLQEEEDQDNEEEELPSFLRQDNKKPSSISEGLCVWCKLRKYPYWPAVVKSVNHKIKKASIVFIDGYIIDQKRIKKGFSVSLRTLKPFNCEDFDKLVDIAKAKYGSALTWSLELISDYKIRIGCGSFVGSLIEYCAADISVPVRRKYTEGTSVLTFPSQEILSEQNHDFDNSEDIILPEHDDVSKKVLPDRAKAARNRANVHLVDFIVSGRKVENRLLAVINGDESSRWMRALRKPTRQWVDVYLEDEEQVDKLYSYLNEVCDSSPHINTCLEKIQADRISLILDVLLPEAIIHAIAGVHQLSLKKAEEKYRSGPCFSNRERQEFDMMIEQQMKLKEIRLCRKQKD